MALTTALIEVLKRTVQEFRDAHHEDLKLPLDKRPSPGAGNSPHRGTHSAGNGTHNGTHKAGAET